jgi:hypothetical protein
MKLSRYVAVFSLLNALTFCLTHSLAQAGEGNNRSHRDGQPNSHKSSKPNASAQWAADPERGWVRADERHQIQEQNQGTGKAKQDRGKHKAKGSKEKTHE